METKETKKIAGPNEPGSAPRRGLLAVAAAVVVAVGVTLVTGQRVSEDSGQVDGLVSAKHSIGSRNPGIDAEAVTAPAPVTGDGGTEAIPAAHVAEPIEFDYRYPKPGEPDYEDYQEMLEHPRFRTAPRNAPPYDPEWRSVITGRREVGPVDLEFIEGALSLPELFELLLGSFRELDTAMITSLRVNRVEYQRILWVEFPQSRPYLRIPADEAWIFQLANLQDALTKALDSYGQTDLRYIRHEVGKVDVYTNFTLHREVTLVAENRDTDRRFIFPGHFSIAEREGRFKIMSLKN